MLNLAYSYTYNRSAISSTMRCKSQFNVFIFLFSNETTTIIRLKIRLIILMQISRMNLYIESEELPPGLNITNLRWLCQSVVMDLHARLSGKKLHGAVAEQIFPIHFTGENIYRWWLG